MHTNFSDVADKLVLQGFIASRDQFAYVRASMQAEYRQYDEQYNLSSIAARLDAQFRSNSNITFSYIKKMVGANPEQILDFDSEIFISPEYLPTFLQNLARNNVRFGHETTLDSHRTQGS
jgi:hypothetical protein